MGQRYTSSNKFNPLLVVLFFIVGIFCSFIITGAAAIAGLWLKPPFAGMLLVFISAWCIYWIQSKMITYSKNRNVALVRILIFIASVLTAIFHMAIVVSSIDLLRGSLQQVHLSLNFIVLRDIIVASLWQLIRNPLYTLRSLWEWGIPWIVYIFVIVISNLLVPQFAADQAKIPFSEDLKRWMTEIPSVGRFEPFPDREQHTVVSAMKREDMGPFIERPRCTSQDPLEYAVLVFYKVGTIHSGYVGVKHYHQKRSKKGELVSNSYQMIEFIPPIRLTEDFASRLEQMINSTAMTGNVEYNKPKYNREEFGYKMYRTAEDALHPDNETYQPNQNSGGYRRDERTSSLSERFHYNISEANHSKPYTPSFTSEDTDDDDKESL